MESLSSIRKCKIRNREFSQGKIVAKVGLTWKSWEDVVSVDVSKMDDDRTQVEVSSRPALRTALVDNGKNLENVQKIAKFLNAHSGSSEQQLTPADADNPHH